MSPSSPLWTPNPSAASQSMVARLMKRHGFDTYAQLHHWSITHLADFWSDLWDDGEVIGTKGSEIYREGSDFISSLFFPEAELNTGENLLAHAGRAHSDEIAVISIQEDGTRITLSWKELESEVRRAIRALHDEGIQPGERIVAWTPNLIEVLIYAIAGLSIGAVLSTSSPDFSPSAVADRFGQIEPKLLLAAPSYRYGGKRFDCLERLAEITTLLPTLKKVIIIGGEEIAESPGFAFQSWRAWLEPHDDDSELSFPRLPFDHPGFILFSSGTTGKPKCITHSAAGILLKLLVEHRYHLDLSPRDRVLFFTTCGWMMWNWVLYLLASGSSIVIYEGSPVHPDPSRLFEIADQEHVTVLGLSAKLIDLARKEELTPGKDLSLAPLRSLLSTGSVLNHESFEFVYQSIKSDLHLISMSGGTDICGCFLTGVATLPVFAGELQGECLGMATAVFNSNGDVAGDDEKGELVCTRPFPSKPIGFWGDTNHQRYRSSYFEGFPGVWTHGDFASRSGHGGYTLYGRSDATLNSRGVRIGTAEIYRVVETIPAVLESMAVAQNWDGDSRVILFVVLKEGFSLDDSLRDEIGLSLKRNASPRHVPDLIIQAPALPRTKSNKLVELAVTDIINGRTVRNRDALADPDILDWFSDCQQIYQ